MEGLGDGDGPFLCGAARTGAGDTGWGVGLSGVTTEGTIVTLVEIVFQGSLGNLK